MLPQPTSKNYKLTAEAVRASIVATLEESLGWTMEGRKVNVTQVLDVLVYAATTGKSIHSACEELTDTADDNTLREYINQALQLEHLAALEDALNALLTVQVPRKVRRGTWDLAIDLHDQPFYGKSARLRAVACRGKARDGTTRFFRIATVCLLVDGVRLTLAVHFVRPDESLSDILKGLLERARPHLGGLRCVFLDKGFASIEVFRLLDEQQVSAVIACPIRGKRGGGTRALCVGHKSYATEHTFHSNLSGSYRSRVTLVYVFHEDKPHEKCIEWRLFVQIHNQMTPHQIRVNYRRRFGIEASYRCLNQVRAYTTTQNPALRFFFLALALVLLNTWIVLRFRYCQVPRQGRLGRLIDEGRFRLHRMAGFIRRAIEQRYLTRDSISALCLPLHP